MPMKQSPLLFCSVAAWLLLGFTDAQSSDASTLGSGAPLTCKVDSRLYSAPYRMGQDRLVGVPLKDGSLVEIDWYRPGQRKILIGGEDRFRECAESVHTLSNREAARKLLSATTIADPGVFVGARVGLCRTVDEGWFFFLKDSIGYIGYSGPSPVPLAIVGMRCE